MSDEYKRMLAAAKNKGLNVTPELDAELRKLAGIPNERIDEAYRRIVVEKLANTFQVTPAVMDSRFVEIKARAALKGGDA